MATVITAAIGKKTNNMTRHATPLTTRHAENLIFAETQISFKGTPHTFSTFVISPGRYTEQTFQNS